MVKIKKGGMRDDQGDGQRQGMCVCVGGGVRRGLGGGEQSGLSGVLKTPP